MGKMNKDKMDKSKSIKRLAVDKKSTAGVDSVSGIKCTPIDKSIFKKDLCDVVVKKDKKESY